MAGGDLGFEFLIRDDAALLKVDEQHLARLQAPLLHDVFFLHRQNARFRRHDDDIVLGDEIARRTQTVTVERRADLSAVGKRHRSRTVPRLHHRRVILIKCATFAIHQRIAGPGFRNEHHRGMRQRIAAHGQEFERVVETGRIRLAVIGDRPQLGNVITKQRRRD